MEPITLRQVEFALAVEDAGAICAASKQLHISQPSLSQQIQALERTLGVELFDRTPAGTRPTEAGQTFLTQAREAVDGIRRARESVASMPQRPLRVGIEDIADIQQVIAAANAAFGAQTAAGVSVVRLATASRMREALQNHTVDLAVGTSLSEWDAVQVPLCTISLSLMTAATPPVADLGSTTWFQVVGTEPHVDKAIAELGLPARPPVVEADSFEFAYAMVAQGLGIALLPDRWKSNQVVTRYPNGPTVPVEISVLATKNFDTRGSKLVAGLLRQFAPAAGDSSLR